MIIVVDYGMGNLRNVRRALEELGQEVLVTSSPADVVKGQKIILPGVGAFGEAVRRIDALGLRGPVLHAVGQGTPLLGICLGMQLLFNGSEESPGVAGLGLIQGEVVKFNAGQKVPHIGWNDVVPTRRSQLFPDERQGVFYFVHSFYLADSVATLGRTSYGVEFTSAVGQGGVFGVQFHPEKSQADGMRLLGNFLMAPGGNREYGLGASKKEH